MKQINPNFRRRRILLSIFIIALTIVISLTGCQQREIVKKSTQKEIFLTLNIQIQKLAEITISQQIKRDIKNKVLPDDIDIAFVCLHNKTGDVLAYIPALESTSSYDNARLALRDVGSTIKPLTYLIALETQAISSDQQFMDEPRTFNQIDTSNETFTVKNHNNHYFNKLITIEEAIGFSSNIAATEAYLQIEPKKFAYFVEKLNLPKNYNANLAALGRWEIPVLVLASAMTVIPNGGYAVSPRFVSEQVLNGEEKIQIPVEKTSPLFKKKYCEIVSEGMKKCLTEGTGKGAMVISRDLPSFARGKTGTSQDSLSVLQSKEITTVLWIGRRNTNKDLKLTGGKTALPLLASFFVKLQKSNPELMPKWD